MDKELVLIEYLSHDRVKCELLWGRKQLPIVLRREEIFIHHNGMYFGRPRNG